MELKNYFLIAFLLLGILLINKTFLKEEKRYYNIILILICVVINFSFRVNYNEYEYFTNENNYLYISLPLVIMIIVYIATIKFRKITIDNSIMLIILLDFLLWLCYGRIYNYLKFWNIFFTYFSIFVIGLIYKNIQGYNFKKISSIFTYIAILNGILGILQFLTNKKLLIGSFNDDILFYQGGEYVKRIVGLAGTNNAAGNLGVILFSIVLFNFLRDKKFENKLALIFTSVFSILTLTRIGYLAIAIEIIIYFLFTRWGFLNRILKKIIIGILILIVGLSIIYIFRDRIYFILFEQRGNTADARAVQFKFLFENIIKFNIFWSGIGVGQYRYYAYNIFGYWDIDIHSQYISLLTENGWIIFLLFIIFNINIFIRAKKQCNNKLEKAFITSLFIGNVICINFNPNEYYTINNWFYYLLMYSFVYKNKILDLNNIRDISAKYVKN